MENMDLHELAERYVLGNLNPEEKETFEKELAINHDLKKEVDLLKGISYAIQDEDLLNFRSMVQEEASQYRESRKGLRIRKVFIRASVAAASIILVATTFFVLSIQGHQPGAASRIYSQYFSPYSSGLYSRSASANAEDQYGRAVRYYSAMNYKAAKLCFDSVLVKDPGHNGALFFSGMAAMELKEFQFASDRFEKIILNANSLYIEQAEWYSGLSQLAINDRKKAVAHFRNLIKAKGYYTSKAQLVLNELSKD